MARLRSSCAPSRSRRSFAHLTVLENVRIALQTRSAATAFDFWRGGSRSLRRARLGPALGAAARSVGPGEPTRTACRRSELSYGRKRALENSTTLALGHPEADAARRAHGQAMAPRGHRQRRGQLIKKRRGEPHRADGRAQPERGREPPFRIASRCWRGARILAEGRYADGLEGPAPSSRPILGSAMAEAELRPGRALSRRRPTLARRSRDLHAWYGESHVLHGVDFEVPTLAEVVTLLGRNGAGKTTHAARHHGHRSARARARSCSRSIETVRHALASHRAAAASAIAPKSAAYSPVALGGGESAAAARGAGRRRACRVDADLRTHVPESEAKALASPGTQAVGGRAADARHRADPAHRAPGCCCSTKSPLFKAHKTCSDSGFGAGKSHLRPAMTDP